MVKHGILWIGFGNFAKRLCPRVEKRRNAEVVYFYYPNKNEAQKRFGPKASWDFEKAIADPTVTAVFITTPNDRHAQYLEPALRRQKHVFVEKPITAFLQDSIELLPQLKSNRNVLMVGHNMRRGTAIREMKQFIDHGKIGKIVSVYANYSKGIALDMEQSNWRFHAKSHREGPLITVGIHLIDVLHYLLGQVESATATIKNISGKTTAPDSNAVLLNFANGATAFLETNYNTPSEEILNVYGTEGSLYLKTGKLFYRAGRDQNRIPSEAEPVNLATTDTLAEEMNEFFDVIEGKKPAVETGYREAFNALAVIEACYQSSGDRKLIEMKSVTKEYFQI